MPEGRASDVIINQQALTLLSWNIGYAGLGREMDFFYEGGLEVRPEKEENEKYLKGIKAFLKTQRGLDFILLQEVDKKARRSYGKNQVEILQSCLPGFESVFARNYDVNFVPVPVNNPMGGVISGLQSFSRFQALTTERVAFEGNFSWPKRLFMLDRCMIIQRFMADNEKIVVLINTHNSAFDDGELRENQFDLIRKVALQEYHKGSYVIVGGDWNRTPPSYDTAGFQNGDAAKIHKLGNVVEDFMPDAWTWAYDPAIPTNRDVNSFYQKGITSTSILDYFLLSPNIEFIEVNTTDLSFQHSDHNPVMIKVKLN